MSKIINENGMEYHSTSIETKSYKYFGNITWNDSMSVVNFFNGTHNEDAPISPKTELIQYLQKISGVTNNQDLENLYGESWRLIIEVNSNQDEEFIIEHEHKILNIYEDHFLKFLELDYRQLQRRCNKAMNKVRHSATTVRENTANEMTKFLKHEKTISNLTKASGGELSEICSKLINVAPESIKSEIFSGTTSTYVKNIISKGEEYLEKNVSEKKWSDYFEEYFDILLFGSDNLNLKVEKSFKDKIFDDNETRRTDIITISELGLPIIIELKKSDCNIFVYDQSHNKLTINSTMAKAISQTYNYIRALISDDETANQLGIKQEFVSLTEAIIVISSSDNMISEKSRDKLINELNKSAEQVKKMEFLELAQINYNLKNIRIVLYDEYINRLKQFGKNMNDRIKGDAPKIIHLDDEIENEIQQENQANEESQQ